MARWPKNFWTTVYTYAMILVGVPLLAWLAYAYVHGWIF